MMLPEVVMNINSGFGLFLFSMLLKINMPLLIFRMNLLFDFQFESMLNAGF